MRELEKKQKMRKRIYSTPALIILAILVALLVKGAYDVTKKMNQSSTYVKDLEVKVADLKARETELKKNIDKLGTSEGVEDEIKGKFSVSKEGEHVAVIVDARTVEATTTEKHSSLFANIWKSIESLWQ